MFKTESKGFFTLMIALCIILTMLFCFLNIQMPEKVHAQSGQWNDYRALSLSLSDPTEENSSSNPYIISSAEELALLSHNVNSGNKYINIYFLQTADIDLDGHYFTPIGLGNNEFSGIYDGGGFTISNLYIDLPLSAVSGLFGNISTTVNPDDESGTIRNVNITSGVIVGSLNVGSVAGYFFGKKLENCYSGVTINQGSGPNQSIGGIAGYNLGVIENCYFYGEINIASGQFVGGIAGRNGLSQSGLNALIYKSFNAGAIRGLNNVGGIAGSNFSNILSVFNSGTVTANEQAGGLVGYNEAVLIDGYNIGNLTFGDSFAGAIVGRLAQNSTISNLYYNKNTANSSYNIKAVGLIDEDISGALDSVEDNVIALHYYEMLTFSNMQFLDESNWIFEQTEQAFGFCPYPQGFNENVKQNAKLALFGGDNQSAMWGEVSDEPYLISIPQQFKFISDNVNNGTDYHNIWLQFDNDIDFSGISDYQPIGAAGSAFKGNVLGNNKSLKNLTYIGAQDNAALFAYADNATFVDFTIDNFNVVNGGNNTALLAAEAVTSVFDGITVINSIINGYDNTGALIGYAINSQIYNSSIQSTEIFASDSVGSFAGNSSLLLISQCFSSATVEGNNNVGGVTGYGSSTIEKSYFTGIVRGYDFVGGLIGWGSHQISSSFVFSSLVEGNNYVGGLAGENNYEYITESYARTNVQGNNFVGGIVGRTVFLDLTTLYYVGSISFISNGFTIGNLNSSSITNVYYNSDFINNENIAANGVGLTTVQLTDGILGMTSAPRQGLIGYYPRINSLDYTESVSQSVECYYFNDGNGASQPFEITSAHQLFNMQRLVESDYVNYGNKSYMLMNDITLSQEFEPIASFANPFQGSFNGRYYSIYNLNINKPDEDYVGFFRALYADSIVEKLNIRPLVISSDEIYGSVIGRNYVGAIAGYSEGFIWNCMNNTDVFGNDYVGGLAGSATNISRSFNTGAILGNNYVGGLTGMASGSIQLSFNSGYLKVNGNYGGGIAGRNTVQIELCYNSGNIESELTAGLFTGNYKGGIVGINNSGATVRNCYNTGGIKGEAAFIGGGLIAENLSSNVSSSYYNNEIAVGLNAIGVGNSSGTNVLGLTTIQMVGTTAFNNMLFIPGNYISNENRSMDADYAPQLLVFYEKQNTVNVSAGENAAIIDIIKNYSKQSVMLRLFGRDVYNPMVWGSQQNPYLIETFDHLDTLSKQVNAGYTFINSYFLVSSDITVLSGFMSIGFYDTQTVTNSKLFNGTFNGNGYTINQLNLGSLSSQYSQGLFGYTGADSLIKNVIIGSGVILGIDKVGSVVGYSLGEVTRCYSSAYVEGQTSVGGIVGQISGKTITHCLFDGDVKGHSNSWGGIVGWLQNSASVYNCWYKLDINKEYTHKLGSESLIYDDRNGYVTAGVDMNADKIEDFIYFDMNANAGFGFDVRNISHGIIGFNLGGIQGNRYYPMYAQNYNGVNLQWYCRFTKPVEIANLENGNAFGAGNYFEGQLVTIIVNPNIGYRLVLDQSKYSYIGDGETIDCSFIMGNTNWIFEAQFEAFGNEESEILNPAGVQATLNSDSFEYDGEAKVYDINITNFIAYAEYYIVEMNYRVEQAISANQYKLLIKLQQGNVIVGLKEIYFSIIPKKLSLELAVLNTLAYTQKQYDKEYSNSVTINNDVISGIIAGDTITLNAMRSYYNEYGQPDHGIGENKELTFDFFTITGSGASNYSVPDAVTIYNGSIIKRNVYINILENNLSKQYDGNAPIIAAHSFEGDLGDGLFVNEFSFERVDGSASDEWNVGVYVVGLTENIAGNKDNYNILFKTQLGDMADYYYFTITPKIITSITFNVPNLQYNGTDQSASVEALYQSSANTWPNADLTFYYNNEVVSQCINAGIYIAKASIPSQNFLLDSEKSVSFTIARINQPSQLLLSDIQDSDYSLTETILQSEGGNGEGELFYEVISGPAVIQQNILKINGTGHISVRAVKEGSTNYNRQVSPAVSFFIAKGTLTAQIADVYINYGDTPVVNITYSGLLRNEQSKSDIKGLIEPEAYINGSVFNVNSTGYPISLRDNGSADGYIIDISQVNAKLYVLKKTIHIVANEKSKIYGSADPMLTYTILEDNTLTLNGALKRATGEGAGKYIIQQNSLTDINNPNYEIIYIPDYFTIYPKELRVSIPVHTKTYGSPDPTPEFLINEDDLRLGDNYLILTGVITRTPGENVGQYDYRYNNVTAGKNYTVRFTQVRYLNIQKANPQLTDLSASKIIYGDTLAKSTITGKANVNGQFIWENTSIMPSAQNSQMTFYNAVFIPQDIANYNVINFQLKLTIEKRKVPVAFIGITYIIYDGTDKKTMSARAYNIREGDDVNILIEYSSEYLINQGEYTATAYINDPNYEIEGNNTVKIIIAKSQLNISVSSAIINEGDCYTPEIVYQGFKNGENKDTLIKQAYVEFVPTTPGVYNLKPDGAEAQNYVINYTAGELTINRKVFESGNLTVEGIFHPNLTISLQRMDNNSSAFTLMENFTKSVLLSNQYKGYTLKEYSNLVYSQSVDQQKMTFKIRTDVPEGTPIIIRYNDGSVEFLKDYKYIDGYVTFEAGNVNGIGILREQNLFEKYGLFILLTSIAVLFFVVSAPIVSLRKRIKKKRERVTPKFYN